MKLLFDLGNTRLKWAWWDGVRLQCGQPAAYREVDFAAQLMGQLQLLPAIQSAWAASVADEKLNAQLVYIVHQTCQIELTFVSSSATACGVRNAYTMPERLGVDRFLALVALHQQQTEPIVLASCGTALTLDALTVEGIHLGGLILPSPDLMQQAAMNRTARIQCIQRGQLKEIANNTEDAVYSGSWLAAAALIERFVTQSTSRFEQAPRLVLTGGGAETLHSLLRMENRIEPDLVLRGLLRIIHAKKY